MTDVHCPERKSNGLRCPALQSLAKQLHSEDVEVRAAAGEAIALIYHSCGISDLDSFLENDEDEADMSPPASPTSTSQDPQDPSQAPQKSMGSPATSLQDPQDQTLQAASQQAPFHPRQDPQNHDEPPSSSLGSAASPSINSSSSAQLPDVSQMRAESHGESESTGGAQAASHSGGCDSDLSQLRPNHSELTRAEHSNRLIAEGAATNQDDQSSEAAHLSSAAAEQSQPHMNGTISASNADDDAADLLRSARQQNQAEAPNLSQAALHNASPSQHSALPPSIKSQNHVAEAMRSGQPSASSKQGHQGRPASRNSKQQAEAISNGLDNVVSRMKELATNRGDKSRRSRRDRASTRSTFRELCNVVEVSQSCNPFSSSFPSSFIPSPSSSSSAWPFQALVIQTNIGHKSVTGNVHFSAFSENYEKVTPVAKSRECI